METVTLHIEGEIAWLTMNRPEVLNAFDQAMVDAMLARLDELAADRRVRAAILTGKGRAFSVGVDLKALSAQALSIQWFRNWDRIAATLERLEMPLVIGARGDCIGGGLGLLLTGDYRIGADNIRVGLGAVKHGLVAGPATHQLAARIGALNARRLCLFDEFLDASEALRIGLIDRVVPESRVEEIAHAAAERVAKFPRSAVRETKRLLAEAAALDLSRFERDYLQAQQRSLESSASLRWKLNR